MVLLYMSPDTLMPLASAFAAVVGVVVMFWQKVRSVFRSIFGRFRRTPEKGA